MGSSTRNTFPRFRKRLEDEIAELKDDFSIIDILKKYYFKKKGLSNLQKNIISVLNSNEYKKVIIGITRVSKAIKDGNATSVGIPISFTSQKNYEKVDSISDFLGLQSELLTNALNKTFEEKNIENIVDFVKEFTGNILKSIIGTFCIEDTIEVVGEDYKENIEDEISDFVDEVLTDIPLDIEYDENNNAISLIEKLDNMFRNIFINLKGN